jgi:hypothetical protein
MVVRDLVTDRDVMRALYKYDRLGAQQFLIRARLRPYHDLCTRLGRTPLPAEGNPGHCPWVRNRQATGGDCDVRTRCSCRARPSSHPKRGDLSSVLSDQLISDLNSD